MPYFTQDKYKAHELIAGDKRREFDFFDGADALAGYGYRIAITHVPTNKTIFFKAFITAFNDTFSQNWNPQEVYGRADPIYNFKNTTRKISLGFKMVAASESEAYENLTKAQMLAQFMYPNYTDIDGAKTVSQSPLIRLSVMNLLNKHGEEAMSPKSDPREVYNSYYNNVPEGLLGFFDNVTFNWNLENNEVGVFHHHDGGGTESSAVLPKLIEVQIGGFSPIHEQHLGWDENNRFGGNFVGTDEAGNSQYEYQDNFPYGTSNTAEAQGTGQVDLPSQESTEFPKPAYSEDELSKDEKAQAEAAIANAQARYGGMFGNMRRNRDLKRMDKYSSSKRQYVQSALAGQEAIDKSYLDEGLSSQEYSQMFDDTYDFVE